MANYRPVSNVSFASKLVERAVAVSDLWVGSFVMFFGMLVSVLW